jgi:hypothetical protein
VLTHVYHYLSGHQREQEEEFQRKREENLRKAEEKTAKNRKKREKLKEKAKKKARVQKQKEKEQEQGNPAAGTIQRHPAFSLFLSLIHHHAHNCASARTCLPTTCAHSSRSQRQEEHRDRPGEQGTAGGAPTKRREAAKHHDADTHTHRQAHRARRTNAIKRES